MGTARLLPGLLEEICRGNWAAGERFSNLLEQVAVQRGAAREGQAGHQGDRLSSEGDAPETQSMFRTPRESEAAVRAPRYGVHHRVPVEGAEAFPVGDLPQPHRMV